MSEQIAKENRGVGTSVVAAIGVSGALLAAIIAKYFTWQFCYFLGGGMGLALLALRIKMFESGLFNEVRKNKNVRRGDVWMILTNLERLGRFFDCILIGIPLWFVIGVLVSFSPEICLELGATGPVNAGDAVFWAYSGLVLGDLASGLVSQWLKSRRAALFIFQLATALFISLFLFSYGKAPDYYYFLCFLLGCSVGYWAIFVTIAAEQFGTNLRATVTTTVPNFVRGSLVLLTTGFKLLTPYVGTVQSCLAIGAACMVISLFATRRISETFGRDLNWNEY